MPQPVQFIRSTEITLKKNEDFLALLTHAIERANKALSEKAHWPKGSSIDEIDTSRTSHFETEELVEQLREEAKNYPGDYFILKRGQKFSEDTKQRLYEILLKIPEPMNLSAK